MKRFRLFSGFTLIELLIVVAIIAILAAIAVPNFLEAQTRSKISRVKADMRSIATSLESYFVDYNHYPTGLCCKDNPTFPYTGTNPRWWPVWFVSELTTPTPYMTSVSFIDPFQPDIDASGIRYEIKSLQYYSYECVPAVKGTQNTRRSWMNYECFETSPIYGNVAVDSVKEWCLESWGPSRRQSGPDGTSAVEWVGWAKYGTLGNKWLIDRVYDATNGTMSPGGIGRFGGMYPANPGTAAVMQ